LIEAFKCRGDSSRTTGAKLLSRVDYPLKAPMRGGPKRVAAASVQTDEQCKHIAILCGVYEVAWKFGLICVGDCADTPRFAVDAIGDW
jgi:hypothetical protein